MKRERIEIPEEEMRRQQEYMEAVCALPHRPESYWVVTFGCQMNAHDSEKIAGMLEEMGMHQAQARDEADFVIFNTCCIRENAERKALGNVTWLKEVRKQRPEMIIAVCGCMVQEAGMAEKLRKQYGFVNLCFGTSMLHRFPELLYKTLDGGQNITAIDDSDVIAEGTPIRRQRKDAAYLTIMYGCDNFCSYCIVPYVRGRERSRRMEEILKEAEGLYAGGVKEVMLLGQNVNSYGKGLSAASGISDENRDISFPALLSALDEIGIPRIRFMTSHPKDLSDELISVMQRGKHILPQFHLPVQSGNNEILEKMNRHYTRERYLERVSRLRESVPGIGLSTDIIVGFPGETEEQFQDTMSLVDTVGYDSAFTFIYSPRTGTKAAQMTGQVSEEVSRDRIQRLISLQEARQQETLKRFIGMEEEVLIEGVSRRSPDEISGKGRHGVSITVPGNKNEIGEIIRCRVTGIKQNTLTAERVANE